MGSTGARDRDAARPNPPSRVTTPYLRASIVALVAGPVVGALTGAAITFDMAGSFARFHTERYVPVLVALAMVRTIAPHLAFLTPVLVAVVVLHRHGRRRPDQRIAHGIGALILAVTVAASDPLVCLAGIAASTVIVGAEADIMSAIGHLDGDDLTFNAAATLVRATLVFAVWPSAGPRVGAGPWGLGRKLVVVGAGAVALSWLLGAGLLAFGKRTGFGGVQADAGGLE